MAKRIFWLAERNIVIIAFTPNKKSVDTIMGINTLFIFNPSTSVNRCGITPLTYFVAQYKQRPGAT
jgi:hypothetical protein